MLIVSIPPCKYIFSLLQLVKFWLRLSEKDRTIEVPLVVLKLTEVGDWNLGAE